MALILIVDDDPDVLALLEIMLRMHGHTVIKTRDGGEVVELALKHKPDLVITDIMMPGVTGGSVYQMIRAHIGASLPVIVSSGTKMRVVAKGDPLLAHCPKPVDQSRMLETIERLCRKKKNRDDQSPPGS
ncbi:MAG: hypothetical protein Kow0059_06140 [Candidatus Sumerlaeia bacterium]